MNLIADRFSSTNALVRELQYDKEENLENDFITGSSQFRKLAPSIALPPISTPQEFLRAHTDDSKNPDCKIKIAHGTTTLAFRFQGGIVVAVDSRATAGSWIASQTVKKVIEINGWWCCRLSILGNMARCTV